MSEAQPPFFKEQRPASIRMWHWISAFFITATLTTVLFGSTLLKTRANIDLVKEQVARKGGEITNDQAWSVAHEYSDKLWMLHKYIGLGLAALLLWRLIIEWTISKDKGISERIRSIVRFPASPERKHYLWVQYGHLIFYGLFSLMALTGLLLAFEDVSWLRPVHEAAETVHKITQYAIYAYLLMHLVGVIRADLGRYGGIVSRMINGR